MTYAFDPDLLDVVELAATMPTRDASTVAAARAQMVDRVAALNADVDVSGLRLEDRIIDGHVPIRVYVPQAPTGLLPAILHVHGGGFTIGSIEAEHRGSASLANEVPSVVVSVDYRLAPEYPFPAGLDDCYAAFRWLHGEAEALGVDTERIALYGASAGGCLAAAVALLARDRGGPKACFQFLSIPVLDDRLDTPSMRAFVDTPIWNRPNAANSWVMYLGQDQGEVTPYAAPARATDLSGLPRAYISTMQFDPLRDEGIIYALRLLQAGVSVELHQFAGTFHGSSMAAEAQSTKRQAAETISVLRRALHPSG
jgi:acetyl esterase